MSFAVMGSANAEIATAYWLGPGSGCIILTEDWDADSVPQLALPTPDVHIVNVRSAPNDFTGRWFGYYRENGHVVFCQEAGKHTQVSFSDTHVIVAGAFNDWGAREPRDRWLLRPHKTSEGDQLWKCSVPESELGAVGEPIPFKFVSIDWHWLKVLPEAPNRAVDAAGNENYVLRGGKGERDVFLFATDHGRGMDYADTIRLNKNHRSRSYPIEPGLSFFDLATELPLGANVGFHTGRFRFPVFRKEDTTFRLFAPRARSVSVELFPAGRSAEGQFIPMHLCDDRLTWEAVVPGNRHGWHYYLHVEGGLDNPSAHFDSKQRILDPWARATAGSAGPAVVIDRSHMPHRRRHPRFRPPARKDLVIVEGHVRDFVAHAPLALPEKDRLGFRGLTRWIDSKQCYLRDLGCNALELLPIAQFDSPTREDYHWGYMSTNYFAPCSHYGHAPQQASQVAEFAELVQTCHRHGLAVILDVVYNHVGEPAFLLFIDKAYYFHLGADGVLENWSGCGNTLKSGSAMARRLIIESLVHLVEAYDVDGFRFDLAELLTIEVLKEIETRLNEVKEGVILIAEPWSFRGNITWDLRTTGFSFWNDGFREFIPEYVREKANADGLRYFMCGSLEHLSTFPAQSVNYVESHDDRCWLDKITENAEFDGRKPTENDIRRTHLMASIVMCSLGIPMLAAGQDFLRSKGGLNNTYRRGDVNALDYDRCQVYSDTHHYFRDWISFRNSPWGELLRLADCPTTGYIRAYSRDDRATLGLLFNADRSAGSRQILYAANPHREPVALHCDAADSDGWQELANVKKLDLGGIDTGRMDLASRDLRLGALDCGLWVRTL